MFEKRLSSFGLPSKVLLTLFLCTMGLGYIFSIFTLYISHKDADGNPGLSMNDIIITYSGGRTQTSTLEIVTNGSMKGYYSSDTDRNAVISWIRSGADKTRYDESVAPILNSSCTICHSPGGSEPGIPLTTYDEVMKYVGVSTDSISPLRLGSLSHTHLISHGVMFLLLSLIFLATRVKDR